MVQDFAGAVELGEALFFFAEFAGMGNEAAPRAAGGVLDVEHLVKQNVLDGTSGDAGTVHAAI
jgi:hypothetical protein